MDRTNRVFRVMTTFDAAHPELQDFIIDYKKYKFGQSVGDGVLPNHHSIRNHGGLIDCDNAACREGGFEVDRVINDANDPDKVQTMACSGNEDMGGRQQRSCPSRISYRGRAIPKV